MTLIGISVWLLVTLAAGAAALGVVLSGVRVIRENQSGLVIKRYGRSLASGRIIALNGEAGTRRGCCRRDGTSVCGAGATRSSRCRWSSCSPEKSRSSSRPTARPIPTERVLARAVACDNFQDADAFLRHHGGARPADPC
jgi:hypothetical protein